jgi:hypothetical protein
MSDTPLIQKLGFEPGDSVFVEDTPAWYSEFADEHELELEPGLPATHAHLFCSRKSDLTDFLKEYNLKQLKKSLWVSWPKQKSSVKSDLNDQTLRDVLLPLGWVDVKVAAIDETWSGLQFLRRKH